MSKIEMALRAAEKLPPEMQEQLAENLLHYVDRYLALRDEIDIGIAQLDRGEFIDGETVFAELRAKIGA